MYDLGKQWNAANDFMSECQSSGSAPSTIDKCEGYQEQLRRNPGWNYLEHLETTSSCGGWCEPSTSLWAYPGEVQDPCSTSAAEDLQSEVTYPSMQVAIYDIFVLFLTAVGIGVL